LYDFRLWWALFVFFAILSLLVVQRRYRRWREAKSALPQLTGPERQMVARRVQLEGWRLLLMIGSIVAMTVLVFGVFLGAPTGVLQLLRGIAVIGVLGVLALGFWR
jgi:hypothetical protein